MNLFDSSIFDLYRQRYKKLSDVSINLVKGYRKTKQLGGFDLPEPPRDTLPKYIQIFCQKMCQSFGVRVVEVEPVPQRHALWASNHISWLDIPVVGSVSPVFFLSKAELADWFLIGKLARGAGTLFIKRGSGDSGSVSDQIANFLKTGSSVVFFPEATTTDGKQIKRLHGKLLQAAMDTGVPIQPIVNCYVNQQGKLDEAAPYYGDISMAQSLKKVLDSNGITAYVLPLEPIDPKGHSRGELTEILQERMETGLKELHERVLKKN